MKTQLLLLCLAIIIVSTDSAMNIPPYFLERTLDFCELHFQMAEDGDFALCSNESTVKILKLNNQTNNYDEFQVINLSASAAAYTQLTKDGKMFAVLVDYDEIKIFYRTSLIDQFQNIQTITAGSYHYHISENHRYLISSMDNGTLYTFNETTPGFQVIENFSEFYDAAVRVSNDGNVIVGISPNNQIQVYYKPSGQDSYSFKNSSDYNARWRNCQVNFDMYPEIYISGSSYDDYYNFIQKFNTQTGQFTLIVNMTLYFADGTPYFADKIQFAKDSKYVAFIHHTSGRYSYAFGKLENDQLIMITNTAEWVQVDNIQDISFMYVPSQDKYYHSITYNNKTEIYLKESICQQMQGAVLDNLDGTCQCQSDYNWNTDSMSCQIVLQNCLNDQGSTGIELANGQCQCIFFYYWNKQNQKCLPHCHRPLSIGVNTDNIQECLCRLPASWNNSVHDCYLNCREIQHSNGQRQSPEVCTCTSPTTWNQSSLSCDLDCSLVLHSSGISGQGCSCINNFIWKQQPILKCVRNCQADDLWDGSYQDDGSCGCVDGAVWNYPQEMCQTLNCDHILYAVGLTEDNLGCQCQDSFEWVHQQQKCVVQCSEIDDNLGLGLNLDPYTCQCQPGSHWSMMALKCARNCSLIGNSTGVNIDTENCQCIIGYSWNQAGTCDIDCGQRIGQIEEYDQVNRRCKCNTPEYYWSQLTSRCQRDCLLEDFAHSVDGSDSDSCQCFIKFQWDTQTKNCILSCNGFFDVSRNADGESCECETNSIYSDRSKSCVVQCSIDPLSTKTFLYDRCECKPNSQWNEETNACQCIQGFTFDENLEQCSGQGTVSGAAVSLGIAGGAIVSGSLVFVGMKYLQKRKRNKENEQQVQVNAREQPPLQSNQDIVKMEGV